MRALSLVISICALAFFIAPAIAADVTIPINKDYTYSNGMIVHLIRVSITDRGMGNVYSPDVDNTIWPKLWFTFENKGTTPINGNLEMAFFDDKGNQYPADKKITDITLNQVEPGKTSDLRFVEAAVLPKDTKITSFVIYEYGKNTTYEIPYEKATTATAGATAISPSATPICGILLVLPLLVIGAMIASRLKR